MRRPTLAFVASGIAAVLCLGGGAYAATTLTGDPGGTPNNAELSDLSEVPANQPDTSGSQRTNVDNPQAPAATPDTGQFDGSSETNAGQDD